jgi:hypothetical protein
VAAGLGGRRREDDRQDRRRDPDDGERRAEPGARGDERPDGGAGGHAHGGARHDGGLPPRGAVGVALGLRDPRDGRRPHDPVGEAEAEPPGEQRREPGQRLRERPDREQHARRERHPARAEAVGEHAGGQRDGERRGAGRGDQRGRRRGREPVGRRELREQRHELGLRDRGDEDERVQEGGEAARGEGRRGMVGWRRGHRHATIRRDA